jgi:hypothetical protein
LRQASIILHSILFNYHHHCIGLMQKSPPIFLKRSKS